MWIAVGGSSGSQTRPYSLSGWGRWACRRCWRAGWTRVWPEWSARRCLVSYVGLRGEAVVGTSHGTYGAGHPGVRRCRPSCGSSGPSAVRADEGGRAGRAADVSRENAGARSNSPANLRVAWGSRSVGLWASGRTRGCSSRHRECGADRRYAMAGSGTFGVRRWRFDAEIGRGTWVRQRSHLIASEAHWPIEVRTFLPIMDWSSAARPPDHQRRLTGFQYASRS